MFSNTWYSRTIYTERMMDIDIQDHTSWPMAMNVSHRCPLSLKPVTRNRASISEVDMMHRGELRCPRSDSWVWKTPCVVNPADRAVNLTHCALMIDIIGCNLSICGLRTWMFWALINDVFEVSSSKSGLKLFHPITSYGNWRGNVMLQWCTSVHICSTHHSNQILQSCVGQWMG